jgi:hypothetical protein
MTVRTRGSRDQRCNPSIQRGNGLSLPKRFRGPGYRLFEELNTTLAAYIRAQLLACLLVGSICGVGFAALGVPYAVLLVRHRIRRLNAHAVRNRLQQSAVRVARGVAEAVISQLRCRIPQARLLHEQRRDCAAQIGRLLNALAADDAENPAEHPREHRDVTLLRSLPGVGQQITATMLAEASQPLNDRDCDTLRTYSGAAPVTKRSGRRQHVVIMRYACNPRLRDALYHWSLGSIKTDPASRAYYDMLRARGHHHGRALRSVGDRWLRILVAMLRNRTLYDPTRFSPRQVVAVA